MNRWIKRSICVLTAVVMLLGCGATAAPDEAAEISDALSETAAYVCRAVPAPQAGSVGGEWAVLGLARAGYAVPDGYFQTYDKAAESYVAACSGVLHERKYTEYSRFILALTAIGKDPANVAGYDLLTPLGDYDRTVWQGISGPIWALIALDSGGYPVPENLSASTRATRELYVNYILSRQLADGGFALSGAAADPDTTAMALLALANYRDRQDAAAAIEKGLSCLSALQKSNGGYESWGVACAESTAQVILALCALDVSIDDARFVKNGVTLLDNLLGFQRAGGGFAHLAGAADINEMATEQALLALTALRRAATGADGIFEMDRLIRTGELRVSAESGTGVARSLVSHYRKDAPVWGETP